MSGKNGTLRDKAQYTDDILRKAQRQLFSMTVEIKIKNCWYRWHQWPQGDFNRKTWKSLDKELNSRKYNMKIFDTYFKKSADVPCIAVY